MDLVGFARLQEVHSGKKVKDIGIICLDRNVYGNREVIFSPPDDTPVKEAYFLHYEYAYPLSETSAGFAIEGNYSGGYVVPFKWPCSLKNEKRHMLPWQIMGVPVVDVGLYFKIHDDDLKKIKELAIKKQP